MAGPLLISRAAVTVTAVVGEEVVEPNLGYLPWVLGENLAGQIDAWVMEQRLGYYPALDFFRDKPEVVDPSLLQLIDEVARFCEEYARRELRRRLRGGFSHVEVERIQNEAYAMPRVRPSQPKSPEMLAKHYAPATLRCELRVATLQKAQVSGIERLMEQRIVQWARPVFDTLKIENIRLTE